MSKEQKNHPTSEEIKILNESVGTLTQRGAVRFDIRTLLTVFNQNNSWGLPQDQIETSKKVLKSFMGRQFLFPEDVEDLTDAFTKEEKFASIDQQKRKDSVSRSINRMKRVGAKVATAALIITGASFGVNKILEWNVYNNLPEVVAQRQVTEQQRIIEDQKQKEDKERQNVLGLNPTKISTTGWRVRYAPIDKSVNYTEIRVEDRQKVRDQSALILPGGGLFSSRFETRIYIYNYDSVITKKPGIRLSVNLKSGSTQDAILRDPVNEEVDARVVILEHIIDDEVDETKLVEISKMETEEGQFKIRFMKKISIDSK